MTLRWPRRRRGTADGTGVPGGEEHFLSAASVRVRAGDGGVGAGRDVSNNAFGPGSQVFDQRQYHLHPSGESPPVRWPLRIGRIPALASAFQPRAALRERIDATVSSESAAALVLSGGGGVGKSQLAAFYAAEAVRGGTDLVLWAPASDVHQVIAAYAHAAALVGAPGLRGVRPEEDAEAFLSWLVTTSRTWFIVLDDVTDPAGMEEWWPESRAGGVGRPLATTRLNDARLTGAGRRRVDVDVYTREEARDYLSGRLHGDGCDHLLDEAADGLAQELGCLPLALGHAAAYLINQGTPCAVYLDRFRDSGRRLDQLLPPEGDTEGYGRRVATGLLLSLDAAQCSEPQGLAEPALALVALLDPAGHPHALWDTEAVLSYLTHFREGAYVKRRWWRRATPPVPVTAEEAHAVLRTLHRYGLITSDPRDELRAVRCHALTGRAVRETVVEEYGISVSISAARGLLAAWPDSDDVSPDLGVVLRANTGALARHAGADLWHPLSLPVLNRAGRSLAGYHHATESIAYNEWLIEQNERHLDANHDSTRLARDRLAFSYREMSRHQDAIPLMERNLSYAERELGWRHPETLAAAGFLAFSYRMSRLHEEADPLEERVLAGIEGLSGTSHPSIRLARVVMANCLNLAGRPEESVAMGEELLAESERTLGEDDSETVLMRAILARYYGSAERPDDAVAMQQQVVAFHQRTDGPEHPASVKAVARLAYWYMRAGRTDEALSLQEEILASRGVTFGPEHPFTLEARFAYAQSLGQLGRMGDAAALLADVLAVQERVLGPEHLQTMNTRLVAHDFRLKAADALGQDLTNELTTPPDD
ncbi:tetratricopeptide repeat protein [Streptomyces sp. C11-1]|uniref:Tetratricopeptide repeat protein n=1 Tax=Streptomyces durocortorensis TaxID=2811104 RepID=A0ABY9VZ05_9ACTN|nr:tetratricopeptide repeat protein [Streptomyces durocortorensis]WNF29135.1 tetratricopeptide repeat protein [Streptomyces durocortorensis]